MAGQYADDETELFYNYYRFYDPKTGRYVTSDPIGLDGGMNTYGYVGASPLLKIDPLGLAEWDATYYTLGGGVDYYGFTAGYTHWWYKLTTDCDNPDRTKNTAQVMALTPNAGVSLSLAVFGRFSGGRGEGTFEDHSGARPNVYAFQGGYAAGVATVALFYSPHGHVKMGQSTGDISGWGISTDMLSAITSGGISILESTDRSDCDCSSDEF